MASHCVLSYMRSTKPEPDLLAEINPEISNFQSERPLTVLFC